MADWAQLCIMYVLALLLLAPMTSCDTLNFVPMSCRNRNHFALTFDDGPSENIPALLSHLKKAKVKATFFLIGSNMKARPGLVKTIYSAGHRVASHTYSHIRLNTASDATVRSELRLADQQFQSILGLTPLLFRYPFGKRSTSSENILRKEFKKTSVLWSVDTRDWEVIWVGMKKEQIFTRLTGQISSMKREQRGPIALFHDLVTGTVELMPKIISYIKSQGYTFVTIDVCLGIPPGRVYVKAPAPSTRHRSPKKGVAKAKMSSLWKPYHIAVPVQGVRPPGRKGL